LHTTNLVLRAFVLHSDSDTRRDVGYTNGGFRLVNMLPAGASGSHHFEFYIAHRIKLFCLDIGLFYKGKHLQSTT
jgi:hypothetical protein